MERKRDIGVDELRLLAAELRIQLLTLIYKAGGGHTGGSLSSLDILVSLYFHTLRYDPAKPEDPGRDRFVLSKGHSVEGYYCVLARAGFISQEELATYGHYGSKLYGHPTMKVPGVEIPSGSLGHGLSVGAGMALAGKRSGADYRVYVLMGDGEQAEGSVWEAAMSASHYRLDNLVGIIDYNGLQITGEVDKVMRISSLPDRWHAFGWKVHEVDGHDIAALTSLLDSLPRESQGPNLIIAHTCKGKGVSFIENIPSWHHRVPTEDEFSRALSELREKQAELVLLADRKGTAHISASSPAVNKVSRETHNPADSGKQARSSDHAAETQKSISCRHAFTATLLSLAKEDPRIYALTSDARGSVTLGTFAEKLPDQFVELGIAEQNAVGIGAGMARAGKRPFVCGPASFYSARSFEQVKNDVAYAGANVKIIGVSGGVSYGALGSTHHSLHDLAAFRAVPGIAVILPADARQTEEVTAFLAKHEGPVYVRLGRSAVPEVYAQDRPSFTFGKANVLAEGNDCTIIAAGETVYHALAASRMLADTGVHCTVLDMPTVKPMDQDAVLDAARNTGFVVCVEEHSIHGGLGSAVSELLSQQHPVPMKIIGFPDEFAPAGSSSQLFAHYGLDAGGIVTAVRQLLPALTKGSKGTR